MTKILTSQIFNKAIREAGSICIIGHVSSDGDCLGSCLGAYNYICALRRENQPEITVCADRPNEKFGFLNGFSGLITQPDERVFNLVIVCDCASPDRMGRFKKYYDSAGLRLLIDHHATNEGFGDYAVIRSGASSTCEILYDLMKKEYFGLETAKCIYTGIVHDTGVFRYSCTGTGTMQAAAKCMELGVDFGSIIEDSFFSMDYNQKKLLGYILYNMRSAYDGKLVYVFLDLETRKNNGGLEVDLDGMIDNMRTTTGVLCAVFLYETPEGHIKASLRSNTDSIDVSAMAVLYGGGGHKRAAGCFMENDPGKAVKEIKELFWKQYEKAVCEG